MFIEPIELAMAIYFAALSSSGSVTTVSFLIDLDRLVSEIVEMFYLLTARKSEVSVSFY